MEVGERIRIFMRDAGVTQSHISRKTGISLPKLNLALNGKRKLTFSEYEEICWALGVEVNVFLSPKPPNGIVTKTSA